MRSLGPPGPGVYLRCRIDKNDKTAASRTTDVGRLG